MRDREVWITANPYEWPGQYGAVITIPLSFLIEVGAFKNMLPMDE